MIDEWTRKTDEILTDNRKLEVPGEKLSHATFDITNPSQTALVLTLRHREDKPAIDRVRYFKARVPSYSVFFALYLKKCLKFW